MVRVLRLEIITYNSMGTVMGLVIGSESRRSRVYDTVRPSTPDAFGPPLFRLRVMNESVVSPAPEFSSVRLAVRPVVHWYCCAARRVVCGTEWIGAPIITCVETAHLPRPPSSPVSRWPGQTVISNSLTLPIIQPPRRSQKDPRLPLDTAGASFWKLAPTGRLGLES